MTQTTPTPATHARTIAALHVLIGMLTDFPDLPAPWIHAIFTIPTHAGPEQERVGRVLDWASLHDDAGPHESIDGLRATTTIGEQVLFSLMTSIEPARSARRYVK